MNTLVVPSIREDSLKVFLDKWMMASAFDSIIIVEDNPEPTFSVKGCHHFSWADIDNDLGEDAWIISRRDSAIRSYGFWKAFEQGAHYIFTLDDDCWPIDDQDFADFIDGHLKNFKNTSNWCESIPGYRTRGLPYFNMGEMTSVVFSMGLWEGVPDLDAVHMLSGNMEQPCLPETRVMPLGQYFPFCGMNFAFKREVTPLAYFPLMGQDSPYGRFDDIWFGIIAKKICDHLGLAITVGRPYIYHSKASDPFNNLIKEAPGIKFNEQFWRIIDNVYLTKRTPSSCMKELGSVLMTSDVDYVAKLGSAMTIWANLFATP